MIEYVGRYVPSPGNEAAGGSSFGAGGPRFLCDAPELARHAGRPWLCAWAAERLDIPKEAMEGSGRPSGAFITSGAATVGMDLLARHALVCGATGSGKTRLALRLLEGQIKAGCSVVMLDPKIETLRHLMMMAHAAGMPPERVTVLSPLLSSSVRSGGGAPGWNPLDAQASGVPPELAADDVVSVLERSTSSWGPRMADLLTNALVVASSHGLSLFELARLLQRDDYREALLRRPLPRQGAGGVATHHISSHNVAYNNIAYAEARDYFVSEFAAWSRSERAGAAAPVLNKFRELLRSPFLRSLLCARRTTLRLGELWHRPGLILVHLDSASLGDEGARLLGGLLAHQLLRTALRSDGAVPVVLALDEMGVSEEFVGGAAAKILAIARSRGLRLLVACQHLAQLSDGLRAALLANTAVQAFFRLGPADARPVACVLSAGTGERVSRIAVDVAKRDAEGNVEAWATVRHTVRDGNGEPLALSGPARQALWSLLRGEDGAAQMAGLSALAQASGIGRLYVRAAGTGEPAELFRYVKGLSPEEYCLEAGPPVRLAVCFPRPRLSVVSRETEAERERGWLRTLGSLPVRHAVLRLAAGPAGTVRVADVPDPHPAPGFERFLSAAVARGGQTAKEIEAAQEWRREQVENIAHGVEIIAGGGEDIEDEESGETMGDGRSLGDGYPLENGTRQDSPSQDEGAASPAPRRGKRTPVARPTPTGRNAAAKGRRILRLPAVGTVAEDGSLA